MQEKKTSSVPGKSPETQKALEVAMSQITKQFGEGSLMLLG